jgi:hypothetical protein
MNDWQDYKPREGLTLQEVEGELVILDQANHRIHQLNPVATAVWSTIEEQQSVRRDKALAAILEQFDVASEQASTDLEHLLQQFVELKLIVAG